MTTNESKFDVGKEWSAGFVASLLPAPRSLSESDHWLAGYDTGYGLRRQKSELLNKYLVSIGHEPMGVVRLA